MGYQPRYRDYICDILGNVYAVDMETATKNHLTLIFYKHSFTCACFSVSCIFWPHGLSADFWIITLPPSSSSTNRNHLLQKSCLGIVLVIFFASPAPLAALLQFLISVSSFYSVPADLVVLLPSQWMALSFNHIQTINMPLSSNPFAALMDATDDMIVDDFEHKYPQDGWDVGSLSASPSIDFRSTDKNASKRSAKKVLRPSIILLALLLMLLRFHPKLVLLPRNNKSKSLH